MHKYIKNKKEYGWVVGHVQGPAFNLHQKKRSPQIVQNGYIVASWLGS